MFNYSDFLWKAQFDYLHVWTVDKMKIGFNFESSTLLCGTLQPIVVTNFIYM
jgi:hypothetical protein